MGDRSNTFFQQYKRDGEWQGIGVYSHWGGVTAQALIVQAARESTARLSDPSYFTRRVVQKALASLNPNADETGEGLWVGYPDDNEHPILVINCMTGLTWLAGELTYRKDAPEHAVHVSEFVIGAST